MVNNRAFEALASSGGRFVAVEEETENDPTFEELRRLVGDDGAVAHSADEAASRVEAALRAGPRDAWRHFESHSYDNRAATVVAALAAARPTREVATVVLFRRADLPLMSRGGRPRPRRGYSVETSRGGDLDIQRRQSLGDAAAATWIWK